MREGRLEALNPFTRKTSERMGALNPFTHKSGCANGGPENRLGLWISQALLRFQSKSAEQGENAVPGLKRSWRKINLSQNHDFFDAGNRFKLWKGIFPAIAAIVAEYGMFTARQ